MTPEEIVSRERERVVAWLRRKECDHAECARVSNLLADAIERGDHLTSDAPNPERKV